MLMPATATPSADGRVHHPSVSVITLLWRNESYVPAFVETLEAAAAKAGTTVEVVAVENGPDGAAAGAAFRQAVADAEHLRVRLLRCADNAGFSGGANDGCAHAGGDVLVVANLDLEFDPAFILEVTARAADLSEPAFLVPSVGSPQVVDSVDSGPLRRDFLHRPAALAATPAPGSRLASGNGSCLIFGRSLYEARRAEVGGVFDAEYHSYYEDVDLFWWAQRRNIPARWVPEIRVVHHHGGSFGGKFRFRDRSADLRTSVMANYRLTVWRHASTLSEIMGWLAGEAGYLVKCVSYAGPSGAGHYVRSWRLSRQRVHAITARRGRWR